VDKEKTTVGKGRKEEKTKRKKGKKEEKEKKKKKRKKKDAERKGKEKRQRSRVARDQPGESAEQTKLRLWENARVSRAFRGSASSLSIHSASQFSSHA
jgi:hypothetical protein